MYPLLQGVGEEGAVDQNVIRLLQVQEQGNMILSVFQHPFPPSVGLDAKCQAEEAQDASMIFVSFHAHCGGTANP